MMIINDKKLHSDIILGPDLDECTKSTKTDSKWYHETFCNVGSVLSCIYYLFFLCLSINNSYF